MAKSRLCVEGRLVVDDDDDDVEARVEGVAFGPVVTLAA